MKPSCPIRSGGLTVHVRFLQHVAFEGPAAIGEWVTARGHSSDVVHLYSETSPHPDRPEDLLVVLGGPMSVHQERVFPWLPEEKRYIRSVIDGGALVLGVCLGAQLLAEVLGASVTSGGGREIGWYPVELTGEGLASSVTGTLPEAFPALHWHGDTFSIPPEAVRLARSEAYENQAFEFDGGRVLALQFHLEATPESLTSLIENLSEELSNSGPWVSSANEMMLSRVRFVDARRRLFALLDAMTIR